MGQIRLVTDDCWTSQETSSLLWNSSVHYHIHKNRSLDLALCHMWPLFNIILPTTWRLPKRTVPLMYSHYNFVCMFSVQCLLLNPSITPVISAERPIIQFSVCPCHFLILLSKWFLSTAWSMLPSVDVVVIGVQLFLLYSRKVQCLSFIKQCAK